MNGSGSVLRAAVAGGVVGAVTAVAMMLLAGAFVLRMAARRLPAMMARMMSEGNLPEPMRACMERCGCGGAGEDAAE